MIGKESLDGVLAQAAAYKKKRQDEPNFFGFDFTYPTVSSRRSTKLKTAVMILLRCE